MLNLQLQQSANSAAPRSQPPRPAAGAQSGDRGTATATTSRLRRLRLALLPLAIIGLHHFAADAPTTLMAASARLIAFILTLELGLVLSGAFQRAETAASDKAKRLGCWLLDQ